jgi:hypothetical protein
MTSDHGSDPTEWSDTPTVFHSHGQGVGEFDKPAPSSPPNDGPDGHHDSSGFDAVGSLIGNLNLGTLLGGSVTVDPGLIDVNLDGEAGNSGALLSVIAGGEGLGRVAVDLNADAIGDIGLPDGAPSCLLGGLDILDGVLCDGILT